MRTIHWKVLQGTKMVLLQKKKPILPLQCSWTEDGGLNKDNHLIEPVVLERNESDIFPAFFWGFSEKPQHPGGSSLQLNHRFSLEPMNISWPWSNGLKSYIDACGLFGPLINKLLLLVILLAACSLSCSERTEETNHSSACEVSWQMHVLPVYLMNGVLMERLESNI